MRAQTSWTVTARAPGATAFIPGAICDASFDTLGLLSKVTSCVANVTPSCSYDSLALSGATETFLNVFILGTPGALLFDLVGVSSATASVGARDAWDATGAPIFFATGSLSSTPAAFVSTTAGKGSGPAQSLPYTGSGSGVIFEALSCFHLHTNPASQVSQAMSNGLYCTATGGCRSKCSYSFCFRSWIQHRVSINPLTPPTSFQALDVRLVG